MKAVHRVFSFAYGVVTLFFLFCGFALIAFAGKELWHAIDPGSAVAARDRLNIVLEVIGLLTIAVASLELGQTILEEEVQRESHMSLPTRVRRFLSRFMIVIIVSLSIEFLVAVFDFIHGEPHLLPHAATIGVATALLLAAWATFVRLNRSAEELEPEAMERIKQEDRKLE